MRKLFLIIVSVLSAVILLGVGMPLISVAGGAGSFGAQCFAPRYGIHATDSKTGKSVGNVHVPARTAGRSVDVAARSRPAETQA